MEDTKRKLGEEVGEAFASPPRATLNKQKKIKANTSPESSSKILLAIYFTYGSVCASILLSPFISPTSSSLVHKSVLYVCTFIAALQIGSKKKKINICSTMVLILAIQRN